MPDDPRIYVLESRTARLEEALSGLEKRLYERADAMDRRIDEHHRELLAALAGNQRETERAVQGAVDRVEERYALVRLGVIALFTAIAWAFLQYLLADWHARPPRALVNPPPLHSTAEQRQRPKEITRE